MDQTTGGKIIALQQAALQDETYQELLEEYRPKNQKLIEILRDMAPVHRDILMDYLGVTGAMHLRLLELSLSKKQIDG